MSLRRTDGIPTITELTWLSVLSLRDLGGRAALADFDVAVAFAGRFSHEQLAVQRPTQPTSEIKHRTRWALTYLKVLGLASNPAPGVWRLTAAGRRVEHEELIMLLRKWNAGRARARTAQAQRQ